MHFPFLGIKVGHSLFSFWTSLPHLSVSCVWVYVCIHYHIASLSYIFIRLAHVPTALSIIIIIVLLTHHHLTMYDA